MMNKIFIGLLLCPAVYLHGAEPADSTLRLMEEITVAANRQQDVKMNVPQQVYILSRAQIERANAQTAADLLTTDGLLTVQKSQQGGGSPMIRGFESSRVLLVMDNVKMNNLIYRAGHLQNIITVDPSILERVEVLYGPSSVSYGSDALGGVVAFRSKNPVLGDGGKTWFSGNAFMRYGSANQ